MLTQVKLESQKSKVKRAPVGFRTQGLEINSYRNTGGKNLGKIFVLCCYVLFRDSIFRT